MTLFEINKALEEMLSNVDPETGEFLADFEELEKLQMSRDEKIRNTLMLIKNTTAEAEGIKNQQKVFAERLKRKENLVRHLTDYLGFCLQGENYTCDEADAFWKKNPPRADYAAENEDTIIEFCKAYAPQCVKVEIKESLIKTELKKSISEGNLIPQVDIVQDTVLKIK